MFYDPFPIIYTTDMARARRFYRDQLGFVETLHDPGDQEPRYVILKLGNHAIALSVPIPPDDGRPFELCVSTANTDAAVQRLREQGVPVVVEPEDKPWKERSAHVADPDGNLVQIVAAL